MPSMKSIKKNRSPQICGKGRNEIAWGYVMKAKPAPDVATAATGIPDLSEKAGSIYQLNLHDMSWLN